MTIDAYQPPYKSAPGCSVPRKPAGIEAALRTLCASIARFGTHDLWRKLLITQANCLSHKLALREALAGNFGHPLSSGGKSGHPYPAIRKTLENIKKGQTVGVLVYHSSPLPVMRDSPGRTRIN